jgi:hypothetical protein
MTSREEVYEAINSERNYQDKRWGPYLSARRDPLPEHGMPGGWRSLDEFVLYMQGYMNELVFAASHYADKDQALDIVRKVTALGVRCMEQHGAPRREGY